MQCLKLALAKKQGKNALAYIFMVELGGGSFHFNQFVWSIAGILKAGFSEATHTVYVYRFCLGDSAGKVRGGWIMQKGCWLAQNLLGEKRSSG